MRHAGELQIVAVHGFDAQHPAGGGDASLVVHEHHMHLRVKGGELRRLLFPVEPEEVRRLLGVSACACVHRMTRVQLQRSKVRVAVCGRAPACVVRAWHGR